MKAVHLQSGQVELREVPVPSRPEGFALIRLLVGGICNTDLELQRGYYGFSGTPGHEFVGEVAEADDPSLVGKRVVGEINLACGLCDFCWRQLGRHCPHRTVLGIVKHPGAFAEFLTLPVANLHVLPDSIPAEHGVFVEPLAAACEILDQVAIACNSEVAVLGDGKLGLLISQLLLAKGLRVHHFGRHRDKLRISENAGAAIEVVGQNGLPAAAYDWAVDATGSPQGLQTAARMLRPRGTLIMKSTVHGEVPIDTAPLIVNELTLVGSRCGRFEPAIQLLALHAIDVEPMITERKKLARAKEAFARAAEKSVLKVLLEA